MILLLKFIKLQQLQYTSTFKTIHTSRTMIGDSAKDTMEKGAAAYVAVDNMANN
jgi:hypothetical protein